MIRRSLIGLLLGVLLLGGACAEPAQEGATESGAAPPAAPTGPTGAATTSPAATGTTAVVVAVVDGDTFAISGGRQVRLVQIDAPEGNRGECYADEARDALRRLLPVGTRVRLEPDPRLDLLDAYGRLLRYVFRGSRNVNLSLVRRGAATVWFFEGQRGRYAEELLQAGRRAKAAKRGLWGACPGTPFDPLHGASTGIGETAPPARAACEGAVSWRKAREHVGKETTVRGPVAGTRFAFDSNGQPTFLNLGVDYPDPDRLTVVIWGRDRDRFPEPPEDAYAGKTICVVGRIDLYEGVPEIVVSRPSQIEIAG